MSGDQIIFPNIIWGVMFEVNINIVYFPFLILIQRVKYSICKIARFENRRCYHETLKLLMQVKSQRNVEKKFPCLQFTVSEI